jgi:hypothetical protein
MAYVSICIGAILASTLRVSHYNIRNSIYQYGKQFVMHLSSHPNRKKEGLRIKKVA